MYLENNCLVKYLNTHKVYNNYSEYFEKSITMALKTVEFRVCVSEFVKLLLIFLILL